MELLFDEIEQRNIEVQYSKYSLPNNMAILRYHLF